MLIFPYILFFLIVNFTVFTVFFKKLFTSLLTTTIIRGVCQNLFFYWQNPPPPTPYCAHCPVFKIQLFLICRETEKPRCPSIGTINRTLNPKILIENITIEFKYERNTRKNIIDNITSKVRENTWWIGYLGSHARHDIYYIVTIDTISSRCPPRCPLLVLLPLSSNNPRASKDDNFK